MLFRSRHIVGKAIFAALETDEPVTVEYRIIRPNGETRYVWTRMVREAVAPGKPPSLFGVNIDITEVRVGDDDLIEKVGGGWTDFDAAVATPDMMGKVGRVARVLGPRGLMPNPKTGTVTTDIAKAVGDIKGGKIEFRVDRNSNLNFIVGKVSFDEKALAENYAAALEEILRAKPSSSKGRYISKIVVSTTMGPGIPVDPNRTRNVAADDEADA